MKNMVLTNNSLEMQATKDEAPNRIYLFPLFVLLISTTIQFRGKTALLASDSDIAFVNDPTQLLVKGFAYLLALVLVVGRLGDSLKLLMSGGAIYLLLLVYILFSSLWSDVPSKVYITWGHYVGVCMVAMAASFYFEASALRILRFIAYTLSISILASIIASIIFHYSIDPTTGRWAGVTGNANTLGLQSLTMLWATVSIIYIDKLRISYVLLICACTITLWGAGSTTSFLICAYIVFSLLFLMRLGDKNPWQRWQRYLLLGFLGTIGFLFALFFLPMLFQLDYATSLIGKDATLTGRTGVWEEALMLISQKPLLGWSFDAATSAMQHIQYAPGQFLNGYLDVLVRGGITGFFLSMIFIFVLAAGLGKMMRNDYQAAMACFIFFGAILIHNISESSLVRATTFFWLFLNLLYFFNAQYHISQKKQ